MLLQSWSRISLELNPEPRLFRAVIWLRRSGFQRANNGRPAHQSVHRSPTRSRLRASPAKLSGYNAPHRSKARCATLRGSDPERSRPSQRRGAGENLWRGSRGYFNPSQMIAGAASLFAFRVPPAVCASQMGRPTLGFIRQSRAPSHGRTAKLGAGGVVLFERNACN